MSELYLDFSEVEDYKAIVERLLSLFQDFGNDVRFILDGWGFLSERWGTPQINLIHIVIMSGLPGIADRAMAAGAVHVLQKPFGGKEMLPIIERFMGRGL